MRREKHFKFKWDDRKAQSNLKKNRISFEEAKSVFLDEYARLIPDPDHSEDEDRFILLGLSERLQMLVVCYYYREDDSVIRLISARKATKHEQRMYEEQRR
ncbi:MAG: BrnT family toxin [Bdellovibrionia bacterium]